MGAEVLNLALVPTILGTFRVAQSWAREIFRSVSRRLSVRREECRARSRISGQLTPFTNQLFEPFEPLESRLQGRRGLQAPRPADLKAYHRARRPPRGAGTGRARFPGGEEHISRSRDEDRVDGDRAEGVGEKREKTER